MHLLGDLFIALQPEYLPQVIATRLVGQASELKLCLCLNENDLFHKLVKYFRRGVSRHIIPYFNNNKRVYYYTAESELIKNLTNRF